MWKNGTFVHGWGTQFMVASCGKQYSSSKLKGHVCMNAAIKYLCIYPKELKIDTPKDIT